MSKSSFIVLMAVVLLIGAALTLGACGEGANKGQNVTSATETTVSIKEMSFNPHTIIIATGTTVTWVNDDNTNHSLTSKDGWFNSETMEPGDSFDFEFDKPGTISYNCKVHPEMEGIVVVQPGGGIAPKLFKDADVNGAYRDSCSGCHGPNREGATGVALVPQRLSQDDAYYFDIIKNGKPGTVMPEHKQIYSDEELWALVGYIRSKPDAKSLEWGLDKMKETRKVVIKPEKLIKTPNHKGNLDNLMLITERETSGIAVMDGDTHTLLGSISASYRAHGYTMHPTDKRWAYNVGRDGWLMKIDLYSLRVAIKIRVGLDSRGIAISDNGKYVIVGNYIPNSAVILDADTLEPIKEIITEGKNPQGEFVKSRVCITSDVSPDLVGPYFILALKEAGQLWRIDWSKTEFPIDKIEDVGNILHDGFLSFDNERFYIASQTDNWMAIADVRNWKLVKKLETGKKPHPGSGAVWSANGKEYGATVHIGEGMVTIWDLGNNEIVAQIPTSGPGLFIRAAENNPYVWADCTFGKPSNEIYAIDKQTFKVAHVIREGTKTVHPELTVDGKFVYISDWQENKVRVYNAYTFKKVAEVQVNTPTGIFNTSRRHEKLGH